MTFFDTTDISILSPTSRQRVAARLRAPAWSNRTFAGALLGLWVFATIAYLRWPLTDTIVPWDSKNQFYPMFRFLADALRHGTVPLWNPYQFAGYPSVADPQSLLFTPTMVLLALIAPEASMRVFDAVIFAHLAVGGCGIIGLARRWRWHPAAGLLAALVFMFGGAASSRLEHTGMIISYSFFPLALWSLQTALDRRSLRLAMVAGLIATLMAIGRDQVAYLCCMALAGAVARQALRSDDWRAYLRDRGPVILVAGFVTLALMIVPILLALQFVRNSNRPGIAYGMALAGSLDPVNLVTLLAPNVFGSLDGLKTYWGPGAGTQAGNDWTDPTIDYLFVGTVPFVLFVWHGLAGGRLLERGARYFALTMVAALVYALGRHTPLFRFVFDWLPGVSLYRRPADATFLVNAMLALLSGYLLHRFIEEGPPQVVLLKSPRGILAVLTSIAAAWLLGAGLAFARHTGHFDQSLLSLLLALGWVVVVSLVLVVMNSRWRRSLAAAVLVAATGGQLFWRNVASVLNAEPHALYAANATLPADQAEGLAILRADIADRRSANVRPRIEVQGVDGPWQNAAEIFKLENTAGYNPLRIAAYERALGVGESTNDPTLRSFPDTFRGYNSRLAGLLGLTYLVLDRPITTLPRYYPRPDTTLLFSGDHFFIYRLTGATVPRVYVAAKVDLVDSDAVIAAGDIPDFDPTRAALVERRQFDGEQAGPLTNGATSGAAEAHIIDETNSRIRIAVYAERSGLLVLHDIFYPGWVATVDGRPAPVLRTNLLFRGVPVSTGHHTVEFSFQPFSLANLVVAARGLRRTH